MTEGEGPVSQDSRYRAGADIGGTFTDVVLVAPDGAYRSRKVLSTTDDYSRGIIEALVELARQMDAPLGEIGDVIHGTTVATNAILENKGATCALITTRGFRDVLELRRLRTPQLYDRFYEPPRPIVERRLRLEVTERIGPDGETLTELDESTVHEAIDRIERDGAEAVAVSLIHSWRNPAHERRIGELVRERMPDVFLSLSCDVLPEIREYERTSTTVLNAYVGPIVERYIDSLDGRLHEAGVGGDLLIMQSNGGIMSAGAAARTPAQIVESGPAAGVIASQANGARAGFPDLISFDMGGTTAKASLIEHGEVARTTEYEVGAGISLSSRLVKGGGHALKLPVIDIAEVGAGGGSIVWIDRGGALKVGPQSAGSMPGPACHNTGGVDPTITDANLLLGYINPEGLAGGEIAVHPDLAEAALHQVVAEPLGLSLLDAAHGVHIVANITMIRAIKAVTTYRGRDPRDFALMAFGGNGPVHATGIAMNLGIGTVIVPPAPGLFSAVGLLEAQLERHFTQTLFGRLDELCGSDIEAAYRDLEARAHREMVGERAEIEALTMHRSADVRYEGQGFELTIDAPAEPATTDRWVSDLIDAFTAEHERTYGHSARDEPVELVNVRLIAVAGHDATIPRQIASDASGPAVPDRQVYFGPQAGLISTPVIARHDLSAAGTTGPLVIQEYDSSTIVPPGANACLDDHGSIVITLATPDA